MYSIFIDSNLLSGAEKRALKLSHELNKRGIECKFLITRRFFRALSAIKYSNFLENYIIVDNSWLYQLREIERVGKIVKYLGLRKLLSLFYKNRVLEIIRNNGIEVVHVFLYSDLRLIQSISQHTSAKTVFEITSPDYVESMSKRKSAYLEAYSYFNAVSDSVYINAAKFIPTPRLGKAPIPFFDPIEYTINQDELFNKKGNIIVFAHRLIPRKNGLLFAKVVKAFLENHSGWQVKILGEGPEHSEINRLLLEEISAGIVVTGYQSNILSELEKSRIFVSIIEPDNYPSQSVLEAMYAGNALLLSDKGFTKKRFFNDNGLLCDIEFDDVLSKLVELVQDVPRLETFGRNSLGLLKARYEKSLYINYLHEMYVSVKSAH